MITSGLVSAVLFLIMSHSKPLNTLAPARPPPSICCVYMVVDVLGQFAEHMYFFFVCIKSHKEIMKVDFL